MQNALNPFHLNELALTGAIEVTFPDPKQSIKAFIAKKCGDIREEEITQISDQDYKGLDKLAGTIYYRLYNLEVECDDLSYAENIGERILSKEEQKMIIESAFTETLLFISKYIPKDRIIATFPNIDLERIEEYDFSNSLLSVFILSDEAFNLIRISEDAPHSDLLNKNGYHIGTHVPDPEPKDGPLGPTKYINTSGKNLIIIKAGGTPTNHLSTDVGKNQWPQEYKQQIAEEIRATLIHELLHDLQIGAQFNHELKEALVEYTSVLINLKNRPGQSTSLAYSTGVAFIGKLLKMGESSSEELLQIYVSLNENSKPIGKRIANTLEEKYGQPATKRILNFEFRDMEDAFNFISNLELQEPIPKEDYSI